MFASSQTLEEQGDAKKGILIFLTVKAINLVKGNFIVVENINFRIPFNYFMQRRRILRTF